MFRTSKRLSPSEYWHSHNVPFWRMSYACGVSDCLGENYRKGMCLYHYKCWKRGTSQQTTTITRKVINTMATIREKINQLTKTREQKLFEKHGLTSDYGNLTDLGRRVVLDKLFADKELRKAILADVEAVEAEEKTTK